MSCNGNIAIRTIKARQTLFDKFKNRTLLRLYLTANIKWLNTSLEKVYSPGEYYFNCMMKTSYTRVIFLLILTSVLSLCNVVQAQNEPLKTPVDYDTVKFGTWKQMSGSKVANSRYGDVNIRIYTYVRYLTQMGLDSTFTNSFGQTSSIDKRQDIQIQKVSIYFSGWFLDPKLRYFIYVWTCNASQGQGAQVVLAGNLLYNFNRHFTLRAGIM